MKNKLTKALASFTMAAALAFTGAAAQAAEIVVTESAEALSIESCAANIKSIYKERYPEQTEIVDEVVDVITADETFIEIFEEEGASAFRIVEDSLHDALDPCAAPAAYDGNFFYSIYYVPSIRQKETTFCGVASMITALMGGGKMNSNTSQETIDQLQYEFAKETGIYSDKDGLINGGVKIWNMEKIMQRYFPVNPMNCTYRTKIFTSYSVENIDRFLEFAFICNTLPIIRVDEPQRLSYYPDNYSLGAHYIVISSVDFDTGEVQVVDPHYSDKYFGRHTIQLDEIKDLVNARGNLWMCIYTNTSENPEDHG